jgi:hypothetical protein
MRLTIAVLVAIVALGACAATAVIANQPPRDEAPAQEAAGEAAEAREDAQAAQLEEPYAARVERLLGKIAVIRASIHFTVHLSHETTRWTVHLPKKRQRIKALRAQIQQVRAAAHEAEH